MSPTIILLALLALPPRGQSPSPEEVLRTAKAGLAWVIGSARPTSDTTLSTWIPVVPADPASSVNDLSLYHGLPGPALAAVQMAAVTGEGADIDRAERLLEALVERWWAAPDGIRSDPGLYTGASSVGSVLLAAHRAGVWQDRAMPETLRIADEIADRIAAGDGMPQVVDIISGRAGIGLFLLEVFRARGRQNHLLAALDIADWLLEHATRESDLLSWPMGPDQPTHYPNFSHGTAGVCFFLGELVEEVEPDLGIPYGEAREAGLRWLAAHGEEGCIVFHHESGGEDLQYFGWCHGPAGTGRLYLQSGGQGVEGADWLIAQGPVPRDAPSGYWQNVSVCCGTAGIMDYMLDSYLATDERRFLEAARAYAAVLIERAESGAGGVFWPQAEHRVRPDLIQAQTGWMQGASGISASLLRLYLVETGAANRIVRLPDEVFLP